ncbi:probable protein phosphatase 2C 74 [Sorghum bicolor]|uniref:probable protein phosphatase 2C 74 n=1 Tax=Sorghum bicolor TaxID=4558 RepID=UPI00081ADAD4|nr:probable protein phosphatase 2C 74 [Sorghum bicolor]|eukprot:XP_002450571.2 probable protein phosphatase 2C 74 [Sorghum bicolor]
MGDKHDRLWIHFFRSGFHVILRCVRRTQRPWTSSPRGSAGTSSPQWWPRERETHGEPWSAAAAAAEEDAVSAAIRAAYLATDHELLAQHQGESGGGGACATTALVKGGHLYVAHVGDCRAVLSRDGAAAALTADHTCSREEERERIERQGGYVSRSGSGGVWRVQGSLAVSRAFGDGALKRWVVADPAVTRVAIDAGCEFLVMASDGLWDKVSNQEAVDVVSGRRATACRELVDMARRRGSRDDVTVMVVDLGRFVW